MNYTFFDPVTGKIAFNFTGETLNEMRQNYPSLEVIDDIFPAKSFYIDVATMTAQPRPNNTAVIDKVSILANGVDELCISLIPANSKIDLRGEISGTFTINDGTFYFTTQEPGIYQINLFSFPEQDTQFIISAE
ncbi:MAG: hypothetical protein QXN55_01680 [Candidatus Nitrosotenuis sp.]